VFGYEVAKFGLKRAPTNREIQRTSPFLSPPSALQMSALETCDRAFRPPQPHTDPNSHHASDLGQTNPPAFTATECDFVWRHASASPRLPFFFG
jgi:hypothetical protein